jgi:putative PIN family toxin of toxin-antitoxin system
MLRVVPDINLLVSSLINPFGVPGRIRAAWERRELMFICSLPMIEKADEVLHRPSIVSAFSSSEVAEERIQRFLRLLRRRAVRTPNRLNLQVVEKDPEDDTVLIAAVEGKADCIISGDRHLKDLGSYENIPIFTPSEFVTRYDVP